MDENENKKYCAECGKEISESRQRRHAVYCSKKCMQARQYGKYVLETDSPRKSNKAPGTTGAIHELVVCVELMRKGFHVFRAQSPACPCDLIAMRRNAILKVEVTTGYINSRGIVTYPAKNEHYDYDMLVAVLHKGDIYYFDNNGTPIDEPENEW